MASFNQKLAISFGSAFMFMLLNLPHTYQVTNNLLPLDLFNTSTNCPTSLGLLLHALVFFVLTLLSMGNVRERAGIKLKHTIYGTLIFFFIASPALYAFVGSVLGSDFADANGCPSTKGVVLHSIVYCLALVGVMYLPNTNK